MLEFLTGNPSFTLSLFSWVCVFLVSYAGIIWKIGAADSTIKEKMSRIERDNEVERVKIRQELIETKLALTNEFIKKDTFQAVMNNIDARLIRLEDKLDSAISKLS